MLVCALPAPANKPAEMIQFFCTNNYFVISRVFRQVEQAFIKELAQLCLQPLNHKFSK